MSTSIISPSPALAPPPPPAPSLSVESKITSSSGSNNSTSSNSSNSDECKLVRYALKDGGLVDVYRNFLSLRDADMLWELCRYRPDVHGHIDVNNKLENKSSATSSTPVTTVAVAVASDEKRHDSGEIVIPWKHDSVVVGKRTVVEPRYTAFLGAHNGLRYTYSQKTMVSSRWPDQVAAVKARIERLLDDKYRFNVTLLNWYGSGEHHVSWHSDSEEDLLANSAIASLSLGATRTFQLRHRSESKREQDRQVALIKRKEGKPLTAADEAALLPGAMPIGRDPELNMKLALNHGDLLIMHGTLQTYWRHRVPPEYVPDVVPPQDDTVAPTVAPPDETAEQRASRLAAYSRRSQKAAKRRATREAASTAAILSNGSRDAPRDTSPVRVPPVGPRICFTFRCVRHDHTALQPAATTDTIAAATISPAAPPVTSQS